MPDFKDGESTEMQGSGSLPYVLKNVRGVYSCSCPARRIFRGGNSVYCEATYLFFRVPSDQIHSIGLRVARFP